MIRPRLWSLVAVIAAALWLPVTVGISPADAHTGLIGSDPEADQTIGKLPSQVRLTFSEDLQTPSYIVVTDPSGDQIASGAAEVAGPVASAPLDGTEPGVYTVAYRVVSADGHPVSGTFDFTLAGTPVNGGTANPDPVTADRPVEEPSFWEQHAEHIAWAVGLVVVAGGLLWFERRRQS